MKRKFHLCHVRTRECGCVDIHWFWLFGHKLEPEWTICDTHMDEWRDAIRAKFRENQP